MDSGRRIAHPKPDGDTDAHPDRNSYAYGYSDADIESHAESETYGYPETTPDSAITSDPAVRDQGVLVSISDQAGATIRLRLTCSYAQGFAADIAAATTPIRGYLCRLKLVRLPL